VPKNAKDKLPEIPKIPHTTFQMKSDDQPIPYFLPIHRTKEKLPFDEFETLYEVMHN